MDREQEKAFAEAVERKQEAQRAAQEASQEKLEKPSTSADDPSPRQKSSRHGQVTAENWNQ
jgi:hypothetical protein